MKRSPYFNDPAVAEMYVSGKTSGEIGEKLNLSPTTVIKILRFQGISVSHGGKRIIENNRALWKLCEDDYLAGVPQKQICRDRGVSVSGLRNHLKRAGLNQIKVKKPYIYKTYVNAHGYIMCTLKESDPMYDFSQPDNVQWGLEHRVVLSNALGRVLLSTETVHHINGNKQDNTLENLELRQGPHGKGFRMVCFDCGSHNVVPTKLNSAKN